MLKKTVTYTDFDGNLRTEDCYFNLTEAELAEMEYSLDGGLSALLKKIINEDNQPQLVKFFKELVVKSYGVKSADGRKFIKNDQVREDFTSSAVYSKIFMELATDSEAASAFVNGIMPKTRFKTDQNIAAVPGQTSIGGVTPSAAN